MATVALGSTREPTRDPGGNTGNGPPPKHESQEDTSTGPRPVNRSTRRQRWRVGMKRVVFTIGHHLRRHTGVGLICAVAYFDPGNWSVDLQAGSQFGYKLLFVVLVSALFAVFLQTLATRLGCVTGLDLAQHTRLLLHTTFPHSPSSPPDINVRNRRLTLLVRWAVLYPLYTLSEVAIIATDLAELLGSGVALSLLFPVLPLWGGVLLTAADVIVVLALGDPVRKDGGPVRLFELIIGVLVFAVLVCMGIVIARIDVQWRSAFDGFLPSKTLGEPGALYTAIGIVGATVMPHALFLGSALATHDRLRHSPASEAEEGELPGIPMDSRLKGMQVSAWADLRLAIGDTFASMPASLKRGIRGLFTISSGSGTGAIQSHAEHENHSFTFVRAHLGHGIVDIAVSLLGLAVVINAMILILSSAVFYYGSSSAGQGSSTPASLEDAYSLLRDTVGSASAILFALALLCAGQSASLTATVAGQVVSQGFIQWRISPALRRLITRFIGLIPSLLVAALIGEAGINAALVASQVVLSIVLPFVVFPLVWLTSSKKIMRVRKVPLAGPGAGDAERERDAGRDGRASAIGSVAPISSAASHNSRPSDNPRSSPVVSLPGDPESAPSAASPASNSPVPPIPTAATPCTGEGSDDDDDEWVDYSNGRIVTAIGYFVWLVILVANIYLIVTLAIGDDGT